MADKIITSQPSVDTCTKYAVMYLTEAKQKETSTFILAGYMALKGLELMRDSEGKASKESHELMTNAMALAAIDKVSTVILSKDGASCRRSLRRTH